MFDATAAGMKDPRDVKLYIRSAEKYGTRIVDSFCKFLKKVLRLHGLRSLQLVLDISYYNGS